MQNQPQTNPNNAGKNKNQNQPSKNNSNADQENQTSFDSQNNGTEINPSKLDKKEIDLDRSGARNTKGHEPYEFNKGQEGNKNLH